MAHKPIDRNKNQAGGRLGTLTLTLMTAALFLTMRNFPMMAATGLKMFFFNLITIFAFLIPIALVSAELATAWPQNGIFHWVEAAFGPLCGTVAIWLQWAQSLFGITSILSYIAATLAWAIDPPLAHNPYYLVTIIISIYWLATLANLRGTRASGLISSVCLLLGVLLPTLMLAVLASLYLLAGGHDYFHFSSTLGAWLPLSFNQKPLVMFLSFIFGIVGIEVSATHAPEVRQVQRTFPRAIFMAAILGLAINLIGGMAIAVVIPSGQLDYVNGSIQALAHLWNQWHWPMLASISAYLIAIGAAGQVSTWIIGPIKGLWAAVHEQGLAPRVLQQTNRHHVPQNLILLQAVAMSTVALLFLFAPVNFIFLMLTSIAVILYSAMYVLLFAAAIHLRNTQPDRPRPYRIPGGQKWGLWLVAGIGLITAIVCLMIGFIPPGSMISITDYGLTVGSALIINLVIPILFYRLRRPSWRLETMEDSAHG